MAHTGRRERRGWEAAPPCCGREPARKDLSQRQARTAKLRDRPDRVRRDFPCFDQPASMGRSRQAYPGRTGFRARKDSASFVPTGLLFRQPQLASELAQSPRSPPRSSTGFPLAGRISFASFALRCSYSAGSCAYDFDFFDELIAIVIAQFFGGQRPTIGAFEPTADDEAEDRHDNQKAYHGPGRTPKLACLTAGARIVS